MEEPYKGNHSWFAPPKVIQDSLDYRLRQFFLQVLFACMRHLSIDKAQKPQLREVRQVFGASVRHAVREHKEKRLQLFQCTDMFQIRVGYVGTRQIECCKFFSLARSCQPASDRLA